MGATRTKIEQVLSTNPQKRFPTMSQKNGAILPPTIPIGSYTFGVSGLHLSLVPKGRCITSIKPEVSLLQA